MAGAADPVSALSLARSRPEDLVSIVSQVGRFCQGFVASFLRPTSLVPASFPIIAVLCG
jgi:hypothetical protein